MTFEELENLTIFSKKSPSSTSGSSSQCDVENINTKIDKI